MTDEAVNRLMREWTLVMAGNFSAVENICSPDCEIWHSSDNKWMPHRDAMRAFNAVQQAGQIPPFDDLRITPTTTGFCCQCSVTFGVSGRVHIAQLITVTGGQIRRIEEYISPEADLSAMYNIDASAAS